MAPRITTTGEFEQRAFEFCAPQQLFRSTIVVGRLYQPRMLSGLTEWSRREPTTSTGSSLKGASGNERVKRPTDLIDHPLFNAGVGIDSAISQEWPVGPMLVDASCIPCLKSEIARREVKFFVIQRIIGNMHFAIFAE